MTDSPENAPDTPDRNLALELVRVTEAAALAAARWVGRGDKDGADGVAVDAMRQMIATVQMRGVVVIGEGEKDNAPMLFNGEEVGDGTGPECDVAVDPIDGTTLTAKGMNNAVSVLAVAPRGSMYDPSAVFYMEKLVTGPEAAAARRHPGSRRRQHPRRGQGQGLASRGRHRRDARPAPPREARRRGAGDRGPDQVHRRRRRRGRDHGGPRPTPASTCCWASAARRRASSPPAR